MNLSLNSTINDNDTSVTIVCCPTIALICSAVLAVISLPIPVVILFSSRKVTGGPYSVEMIYIRAFLVADVILSVYGLSRPLQSWIEPRWANCFLSETLLSVAYVATCMTLTSACLDCRLRSRGHAFAAKSTSTFVLILLWNCSFVVGFLPQVKPRPLGCDLLEMLGFTYCICLVAMLLVSLTCSAGLLFAQFRITIHRSALNPAAYMSSTTCTDTTSSTTPITSTLPTTYTTSTNSAIPTAPVTSAFPTTSTTIIPANELRRRPTGPLLKLLFVELIAIALYGVPSVIYVGAVYFRSPDHYTNYLLSLAAVLQTKPLLGTAARCLVNKKLKAIVKGVFGPGQDRHPSAALSYIIRGVVNEAFASEQISADISNGRQRSKSLGDETKIRIQRYNVLFPHRRSPSFPLYDPHCPLHGGKRETPADTGVRRYVSYPRDTPTMKIPVKKRMTNHPRSKEARQLDRKRFLFPGLS